MTQIAKIVGSNSHVDYVARVIDELDTQDPPAAGDYGFSTFVSMSLDDGTEIIGIVYNSILMNPDYANYGPRLSPRGDLQEFSPDYLNERGCLIGILILGAMDKDTKNVVHGVPSHVVPAGQDVEKCPDKIVEKFHLGENGKLELHYYSQVISHAGNFASPLLEAVIERLANGSFEAFEDQLAILGQNLAWQRTIGATRL